MWTLPHKDAQEEAIFIRFAFQPKLAKVYFWTIRNWYSSSVALREHFSPEQIKRGTIHQTNKAFERYFRIGADEIRGIYKEASSGSKKAFVEKLSKMKRKQ